MTSRHRLTSTIRPRDFRSAFLIAIVRHQLSETVRRGAALPLLMKDADPVSALVRVDVARDRSSGDSAPAQTADPHVRPGAPDIDRPRADWACRSDST